jgi:hypothetical protein
VAKFPGAFSLIICKYSSAVGNFIRYLKGVAEIKLKYSQLWYDFFYKLSDLGLPIIPLNTNQEQFYRFYFSQTFESRPI